MNAKLFLASQGENCTVVRKYAESAAMRVNPAAVLNHEQQGAVMADLTTSADLQVMQKSTEAKLVMLLMVNWINGCQA